MDAQRTQLSLEIDLLLCYLQTPGEPEILKKIKAQKAKWVLLQEQIPLLEPAAAAEKFNTLLKEGQYDYTFHFLDKTDCKNYTLNHPIFFRLLALGIQFLCRPLKADIQAQTPPIIEHKEAILALSKKEKLTVLESLEMMARCCALSNEIAAIFAARGGFQPQPLPQ